MKKAFESFEIALSTDYTEEELRAAVKSRIGNAPYVILIKSLDARNHSNIVWRFSIGPSRGDLLAVKPCIRKKRVIVVGYGPAGYFCSLVLAMSGFEVTVIEQGAEIREREKRIHDFIKNRNFTSEGTYVYGEGGAGTFSDGKLTSRTRAISKEKHFILNTYVQCGAPEEILFLSKPHIGSDILRRMMPCLREHLENYGAAVKFREKVISFSDSESACTVETTSGEYHADAVVFSTGHSDFDTYRMMINNGLRFKIKTFAVGMRMEHEQSLINRLQWGSEKINGLKSAEYQLSSTTSKLPVYTFCMCPGGRIVPSSATVNRNTVNGASEYARDGKYANSAVVAAVNLEQAMGITDPLAAIDYLENIEKRSGRRGIFETPSATIESFIKRGASPVGYSTYPFSLYTDDYASLYDPVITDSLREGLISFSKRMKGFASGSLIGIETTTSPPIQLQREEAARAAGFSSIYMCGEGSGFAGGIISSGADGIRCALGIIERFRG